MALLFLLVTAIQFLENHAHPLECPTDCICYPDYLHNLKSWKWVESDIKYDRDDPEHEGFNPYLEHNEVMENPKLHVKRLQESMLSTVTCMIRTNDTEELEHIFNSISSNTQVLSLIQAPGVGIVRLEKQYFKNFHSLVGLEINGYSEKSDITEISGDCFMDLHSLTYLNLETVRLIQTSVENNIHETFSRFVKINYTFNDVLTNEITSQVLIISPDKDGSEENELLPYSEYKKSLQKEKTAPLQPTFRVAFTSLTKLQHLKLSGCNLHDISWDMFYKLDSLKFLVLDENDLLFLPDFVFYATSNLTALSLSRNRILNLQTVGLAGLLYLQKLDVSHNNITHLSELSLPPFPHLEVADFRHNPITAIFPNTFEIMNSTKTLYLGSTTTRLELSPNSFYGLSSLTKLDITNVKIDLMGKAMLKGMPQLKTLVMTGSIPRISYDAFGEVTNLEKIILRHCGIKKISMDAFFGLFSLIELDLSYNSISFLPPGIFEDQRSLREVYLQHNQLTTLPANIIENLPVKIFRLEANPWHCSCDMKHWNPQQTNRVKRYHIPTKNNTLCQKVYVKGSMCFETYEPKFEATYSYEKRVSPVCETPIKFNQQSVFQVLRRGLKHCSLMTNNSDNTKTEKKEKKLKAIPFPENYSFDTLKALEKQLLAKPVKVKKNKTQDATISTQDNSAIYPSGSPPATDMSNNLQVFNPTINVSESKLTYQENSLDFKGTSLGISEVPLEKNIFIAQNETVSNIKPPVDNLQKHTKEHKMKGRKKNRNKPHARVSNKSERVSSNSESDQSSVLPTISKKAMKLARMLKRQHVQI